MKYVVWETAHGSHILKVDENGVQTLVVLDTDNLGKLEYLEWLSLGNEPTQLVL